MSIINGYSHPIVKLFDPRNPSEPRFTIDLPLTNSGGMIETYTVRKITHELINPDLASPEITTAQLILGYQITFTLHYDRFISGEDLYGGVKKILDASKAGWRIVIVPRADAPWREFDVLLANDTLELGINKGGKSAVFHRLPVVIFRTKSLEPDLKWYPPGYTEPGGGTGLAIEGEGV
ncbi:MAG: hypothetical protein K8I03_14585 [Ignavibacteria bacterium]|nr:hypothetical protein [Ignavibacteria bacterium]